MARMWRDREGAKLDIPSSVLVRGGRSPSPSGLQTSRTGPTTIMKVTVRGQPGFVSGESYSVVPDGSGHVPSDQLSPKTESFLIELLPASPAWPSSVVRPSICSMPFRVE